MDEAIDAQQRELKTTANAERKNDDRTLQILRSDLGTFNELNQNENSLQLRLSSDQKL